MPRAVAWMLLGGVGVAASSLPLGCTLVTDADHLSEGCASDQKACSGQCVSVFDVERGCGSASCLPCILAKATPVCSEQTQACAIAMCVDEYEDCDQKADNGCEVHLATNVEHCGACGFACPLPPRGTPACGSSSCYVRECESGYGDCNHSFDDGCEVRLTTSARHCGACGNECAGDEECHDGECR